MLCVPILIVKAVHDPVGGSLLLTLSLLHVIGGINDFSELHFYI